ncbi:MAG: hypothetical protein AAGG75_14155 [Bacteroidota bacterium]
MSFESQLINTKIFQKYKTLRYVLYTFCLVSFILFLMISIYMDDNGMPLNGLKWVSFGIGTLALATGLFYHLTVKPKRQGQLYIDTSTIAISGDNFEAAAFDMTQVKNIKIERGATYHLAYREDDEWLYSGDNWLEFSYQGQRYVYEFEIDSEEKNAEFEGLLKELREQRIAVKFTSI